MLLTPLQINYWNQLKNYHLDDIDKCLSIDANYAASKMMFTWLEIMAMFYGGVVENPPGEYFVLAGGGGRSTEVKNFFGKDWEPTNISNQFTNFVDNIEALRDFRSSTFRVGTKTITGAKLLYKHFRSGMIHEGHSKIGTQIFRENSQVIIISDSINNTISLNIQYLRDLVRQSTFEFEEMLRSEEDGRTERWQARYDYITKIDY